MASWNTHTIFKKVKNQIVGRERETRNILATLNIGRHILLEAPPGCSKSTILRAITKETPELKFFFVEGQADLTVSKLVGYFDPGSVMRDGYCEENFIKGPLTRAMEEGAILYIEEFNRAPSDVLNALITAIEEGELEIPRKGMVRAHPNFRLVAAMNPSDEIATTRIPRALYDRICRIHLTYQNKEEEMAIVEIKTGEKERSLIDFAVEVTRRTRTHKEVRQGASIRGAMDLVLLVRELHSIQKNLTLEAVIDAALIALSGRIWMDETSERTADEIVREIINSLLREEDFKFLSKNFEDPKGQKKSQDPSVGKGKQETEDTRKLGKQTPMEREPSWRSIQEKDREMYQQRIQEALDASDIQELIRLAQITPFRVAMLVSETEELLKSLVDDLQGLELLTLIYEHLHGEMRKKARKWAAKLLLRLVGKQLGTQQVLPHYLSRPFNEGGLELDLDGTVERLIENPVCPHPEDFRIVEREKRRKLCVLILDHSFSMTGEKLLMAATAAGTIALMLESTDFGIVSFNTFAKSLKRIGERMHPEKLVDKVLGLRAQGYTNIKSALNYSLDELMRMDAKDKIGILLSDGEPTVGGSPLEVAKRFNNLHVIGFPRSVRWICGALAKNGHGRCVFVNKVRDIPKAISSVLRP